jgi:hypothetical protein
MGIFRYWYDTDETRMENKRKEQLSHKRHKAGYVDRLRFFVLLVSFRGFFHPAAAASAVCRSVCQSTAVFTSHEKWISVCVTFTVEESCGVLVISFDR